MDDNAHCRRRDARYDESVWIVRCGYESEQGDHWKQGRKKIEMSEKYPLYPRLSQEAQAEAQALMDGFKERLLKLCEETLGQLYCDVSAYIESDHWTNYRNDLLAGLRNYGNRKIQASYDFAKIRRAIYEKYRDEIVADLNQDLLAEVDDLKKELEREREYKWQ